MSKRARALKNLYLRGAVNRDGLHRAVEDGVITEAEFAQIAGDAE